MLFSCVGCVSSKDYDLFEIVTKLQTQRDLLTSARLTYKTNFPINSISTMLFQKTTKGCFYKNSTFFSMLDVPELPEQTQVKILTPDFLVDWIEFNGKIQAIHKRPAKAGDYHMNFFGTCDLEDLRRQAGKENIMISEEIYNGFDTYVFTDLNNDKTTSIYKIDKATGITVYSCYNYIAGKSDDEYSVIKLEVNPQLDVKEFDINRIEE